MVNSELNLENEDKPSIMNSSRNPNTNIMDSKSPRDTIESGGVVKDPAEFLKVPKNKRIIQKLGNRHPIRKQATLPVPSGPVIDELDDPDDPHDNEDLSASAISSDEISDEN
jgi:hypothetical protein